MNLCSGRLEHVGRPVPAVSGLQDHVRAGPGLLDLQAQGYRVVDDSYRAQLLALIGLPHDDGSPAVQVDADVLVSVILAHQGPCGEHRRRAQAAP